MLAAADERGAAVVTWGAGRHMGLGNQLDRYDLALRTTKLDRVLEYEPADLTVAVQAGVPIGTLQALLAEHGQFLPIDAPAEATIGGALAAGVSGPSRHGHGLPRDWLLGCRVAHPDGTISKGGGRVVKNVAGYDMPKLSMGALGTLGVIVEATFKVAPLAALQETLIATHQSLEEAAKMIFAADARRLALRGVALRTGAEKGIEAAFWLAGPPAAVERTSRELADLCHAAQTRSLAGTDSERWWAELTEADITSDSRVALRAFLPPSAVEGFVRQMGAIARDAGLPLATLSYPTTGLALARLEGAAESLTEAIESARKQATQVDGSLVVTTAPAAVKRRIDVWGDAGSALPTMRRLKEQFDPHGTLNPGRFFGGL